MIEGTQDSDKSCAFLHTGKNGVAQKRAWLCGDAQLVHLVLERTAAGFEHLGGAGLYPV